MKAFLAARLGDAGSVARADLVTSVRSAGRLLLCTTGFYTAAERDLRFDAGVFTPWMAVAAA